MTSFIQSITPSAIPGILTNNHIMGNPCLSCSRNGWGASAVDALSTALVMQQKDIVNQIIDYIPTIDYGSTSTQVSLFETTIRYLGGMLSGYDFLTGPLADLADNVRAILSGATNSIMSTSALR